LYSVRVYLYVYVLSLYVCVCVHTPQGHACIRLENMVTYTWRLASTGARISLD
jgi:hypothetical protein